MQFSGVDRFPICEQASSILPKVHSADFEAFRDRSRSKMMSNEGRNHSAASKFSRDMANELHMKEPRNRKYTILDAECGIVEAQVQVRPLLSSLHRPWQICGILLSFLIFAIVIKFDFIIDIENLHTGEPKSRIWTFELLKLGESSIAAVPAGITTTLHPLLSYTGYDFELFSDESETSASNESSSSRVVKLNARPKFKIAHAAAISAKDAFVSTKNIAELTLKELGITLRYAIESSKEGFDKNKFTRNLRPRVEFVIAAMEKVVDRSRGKGVKNVRTRTRSPDTGAIDALKFCAAMRIFAEWRLVRTVPDGYKGYVIGMNLGQKDIVQNVAKIEKAAHDWIDHASEMCNDESCLRGLTSPTLRDLLMFEIEQDVHKKRPVLTDNTAGMGLLWTLRQLEYQMKIFENVLNLDQFAKSRDTITEAYSHVYSEYHGWAIQRIFTYSFQAAPEVGVVFNHMNPHRLKELQESSPRSNLTTKGSSVEKTNWLENVVNFFKDIAGDKDEGRQESSTPTMEVSLENGVEEIEEYDREKFISSKMKKDAEENMAYFLQLSQPLLDDLSDLFEECNMNDPTRV